MKMSDKLFSEIACDLNMIAFIKYVVIKIGPERQEK